MTWVTITPDNVSSIQDPLTSTEIEVILRDQDSEREARNMVLKFRPALAWVLSQLNAWGKEIPTICRSGDGLPVVSPSKATFKDLGELCQQVHQLEDGPFLQAETDPIDAYILIRGSLNSGTYQRTLIEVCVQARVWPILRYDHQEGGGHQHPESPRQRRARGE